MNGNVYFDLSFSSGILTHAQKEYTLKCDILTQLTRLFDKNKLFYASNKNGKFRELLFKCKLHLSSTCDNKILPLYHMAHTYYVVIDKIN